MKYFYKLLLQATITATFIAACSPKQQPVATAPAKPDKPKSEYKSYKEIVTKEAITHKGLFNTHMVGEKLFYEIPFQYLDKDLLLISRIAQCPSNLSPYLNAGTSVSEQVVRFSPMRKQIHMKVISYSQVADENLPIAQSVAVNNYEPILQSFKIEGFNNDSTALLIEVTDLFTKDVQMISALNSQLRQQYKIGRLDNSRTFIEAARSYPQNVEVRHTLTYDAGTPPQGNRTGTITIGMNQSMVLLPENPMMPRLADDRVGWFTVNQVDYSLDVQKAGTKTYLKRWRLEPSDPEAYARGELVEPVKPIVYYLDPATPEKWRPYFKQGIEDWQATFEAAGFKNAIIAKDPPSADEDPDFNPEDVRYSTVRYVASLTRNAIGPSVADPRTGEIIESDIIWYHNHMRSYRNRYLIETGAANPKARDLNNIPDEEMGEMMRRVIAHEIGHALGLPHNMKASSAYPVDSLRSATFTQKYGVAATIMDYARVNYIAQPGDKDIVFIRQMGPYDTYAINWGYRVIPGAKTPEEEKETLNQWIMEKDGDPIYRFGSSTGYDPSAQTEDLGDDPVKASTYGMMNLKRVVPNLISWTATSGENYDDLKEVFGELLGQWQRYVGHVLTVIGGVYIDQKTTDMAGNVYTFVSGNKQREAVRFMTDHAFQAHSWLMNENIISKTDPANGIERMSGIYTRQIDGLLDPSRLQRLVEQEARNGKDAYAITSYLEDLRKGIYSEIFSGRRADAYRRSLQRIYVDKLIEKLQDEKLNPFQNRFVGSASQAEYRAIIRAELRLLQTEMNRRKNAYADATMKAHVSDLAERIGVALDR